MQHFVSNIYVLHVVLIYFILIALYHYIVWLYHDLFICPSVYGIGVFQFGDTLSGAAVNIHAHAIWHLCVRLHLIYYSSELDCCALRCTHIFSFHRYCKNSVQRQFYYNQQRMRVPVAPYHCQHLIVSFNISYYGQCV